jgi:putative mRNA 3-end processing factor
MTWDSDLLVPTERGLFCPDGGFYVDPWKPVERAVVTHAHSDHVAYGCGEYLTSRSGMRVLAARLGAGEGGAVETDPAAGSDATTRRLQVSGVEYRTPVDFESVRVSLHPAGHILGSAQVRVERRAAGGRRGETWVVSGDYKVGAADPTCEAFESVPCDVFITESTFGLPIYRWPEERGVFGQIDAWWRANVAKGRTSIVFAYALGKAQRVLAGVDASIGPIAAHGAVKRMCDLYRGEGVALPEVKYAAGEVLDEIRSAGGLVVAPPSALGSPWVRKFAASEGGMSAAFVSGWMRVRGTRRRKAIDRGFVVSDHADWPGLLWAVRESGAKRVGVTHGYVRPMVRWLQESGVEAFAVPTRYTGETGEEGLEPGGKAGQTASDGDGSVEPAGGEQGGP